MKGTQQPHHGLLAALVRAALIMALAGAVWSVYQRLPRGEGAVFGSAQPAATNLRIVLERASIKFPVNSDKIPVELFPINMEATRNEYYSERRPGVSFNNFAARRMGDRRKVAAALDERGETVIAVPPGKWWVHATIGGEQELTWRLPVNVTGREVTVELTYENAYLRAKRF